jgi:hypothetical protein
LPIWFKHQKYFWILVAISFLRKGDCFLWLNFCEPATVLQIAPFHIKPVVNLLFKFQPMKKLNILLSLLILILAASCAKNMLTMSVTVPAPVTIAPELKKAGIINRCKPTDKGKMFDDIDKVLSAEGKNLDRDGAKLALTGVYDALSGFNRFDAVKQIGDSFPGSPSANVFPAQLDWATIDSICKKNDVEIIFALEFYDTDSKIDYSTVTKQMTNPLGLNIPVIEHHATITTVIKTGWRIYEPASRIVSDEFILSEVVVSEGAGINPLVAVGAISGRKEAVNQASRTIGQHYAARIMPYWIRVSREYFVRGSSDFKIAKRRAQVGDWDGAAELWNRQTTNPKRKAAGRACYNMGISCEINGDLDGAYNWVSKSYTDYKTRAARDYLRILKYRIAQRDELKYQRGE